MKVMVTARAFWVSGGSAKHAMEEAGFEVAQSPVAGPISEEGLIPLLQDCDAVIASSDAYSRQLFDAVPRLKIVSRCGIGIDSVDLAAATDAGVLVTNTPGAMTEAVSDYAFALLMAAARRLPESVECMKRGDWNEFAGVMVFGKTLGLIGFGRTGRALAQRATGFKMRILVFDPPLANAKLADAPPVEFVSLETLLAESDFVSIHAPSLPETREMMNAERFARMKPTAYLVNTARGALVDESALIEALEKGVIAGAAIDVYQQEPLPADHPLRNVPRLLVTPHNAFNTYESAEEMSRQSAMNILEIARGEKPENVCNPTVWDSPALRWRGA